MTTRRHSISAQFMQAATAKAAGGRGTRERMHSTFKQLERIAKELRFGDISPQRLTLRQVAAFVKKRLEEGISVRALESDVSSIRRAIKGAGRHLDARLFSRDAIHLPAGSRKGTGIAIDEVVLKNAIENAKPRTAAILALQSLLGLRANEAIECKESIRIWEKSLREGRAHVDVRHGSKGGRPRSIYIHLKARGAVHAAILRLLVETGGGKDFPIAEALNGDRAARIYNHELALLGLRGAQSSHALRRYFAVNQYRAYVADGELPRVALSRLAADLGHGESRGRWVLNNYIRLSLTIEELAAIPGRGTRR